MSRFWTNVSLSGLPWFIAGVSLMCLADSPSAQEMTGRATIAASNMPNSVPADRREYDAADLVFDVNRLRRTTISVTGSISCQTAHKCILALPAPLDDMVSVGLENLPSEVRRRIILGGQKDACPERLTGFFDGVHLEVSAVEIKSYPECIKTFPGLSEMVGPAVDPARS
jgi:hypothetical protein